MTNRYLLETVYPDNPKWFAMESLLNLAYYVNIKKKILNKNHNIIIITGL